MFTGFVSYPNWGAYTAQLALGGSFSDVDSYDVGGIAPLGVQLEYMLADYIGISFDGIFNTWNAEWTSMEFIDGSFQQVESSASVRRLRALIGLNYHMDDLKNDKLNIYGGVAIGFNNRNLDLNNNSSNVQDFWDGLIPFPLAGRARAGLRYFVTDDIGISTEIGVGGPILRFALTYKMSTGSED